MSVMQTSKNSLKVTDVQLTWYQCVNYDSTNARQFQNTLQMLESNCL